MNRYIKQSSVVVPQVGNGKLGVYDNKLKTVDAHYQKLNQYGYTILEVSDDWTKYTIRHNHCGTTFNRSIQCARDTVLIKCQYNLCPKCQPRLTQTSKGEQELIEYIKSIYDGEVLENDRMALAPQEIDVYLPELNLGFEYNGIFWHSDRSNQGVYNLSNKTNQALMQGIQLIHILEDEWETKRDVVKSRIASILGKIDTTIYARKCEIVEIDFNTAKTFLKEHHLQGDDRSKFRYGAYYNGQLVSVMTFGVTNMTKGGDGSMWELNRFANKMGINVVGIASRFIKKFRVDHPGPIISYSDSRWSVGKVYFKLGFKYQGKSSPSYWYYAPNSMNKLHRSNFMKHKLVKEGYDETKTEFQIMDERGYIRVYDCGTIKWLLE